VKGRRKRAFKRRPGRPSPYDQPNVMITTTAVEWKIGNVFSTAPDSVALQDASFPATELRRRAAAKEYFELHRPELKKLGNREAALSHVAELYHIDAETFINWMNGSQRRRSRKYQH
jgi:hypothetical protein